MRDTRSAFASKLLFISSVKQPAFSLIELLVVVAIIITLSGLSLVGYNSFQDRQVVNRAAENLASDLRLAQQKAISGEKISGRSPWCVASTERLKGWRVNFQSTTTYVLEGVCCTNADCTTTSISSAVAKTVALSGVIATSTPTILFSTLQGSAPATTVVLNGTSAGAASYFKTVTVTTSGAVSIQ